MLGVLFFGNGVENVLVYLVGIACLIVFGGRCGCGSCGERSYLGVVFSMCDVV